MNSLLLWSVHTSRATPETAKLANPQIPDPQERQLQCPTPGSTWLLRHPEAKGVLRDFTPKLPGALFRARPSAGIDGLGSGK